MGSSDVARHVLVTRRIEAVSGIRPVTLLIASGIVLVTLILIVTGIAANHLRTQAVLTAQNELVRIDSVLAESGNRSLAIVDARLADVAGQLNRADDAASLRRAASAPETGTLLRGGLGRSPRIDAIALVAADGEVLAHAGDWPAADAAIRDLAAALRAQPGQARIVGAAICNPQTGVSLIPLAHHVTGPDGAQTGAVVGLIPAAYFTSLFAAVPVPSDTVIALLRADGALLTRYPAATGPIADPAGNTRNPATVLVDGVVTAVSKVGTTGGNGLIEAVRPLADFPAAIAISRSANQVLAEWAHQGLWFAGFALVLSLAIGIMVYLIARQFQTHADLAAMRAERIEAEKIEIERARLAAEAELLKSERLSVLGQLTATVAHELRNPLSALRNTLFTVKELTTAAGVKLDRPIGRMERSIERCDRIIADLLEYTRNREISRAAIRIDRWLTDLVAEQTVPPPIVLTAELGAGETVVEIDPDRFRRVVINLIENAVQALAETAPARDKRIALRTDTVDGELVLAVEDTGPGIPPENLARIFEPLFSTKSFGTGLGLPTVKQIVNQHGGMIGVDSDLGRGTCVTVRLPLAAEARRVEKVAA